MYTSLYSKNRNSYKLMKKIYLMRHGKAEEASGNMSDFDRSLQRMGLINTCKIAQEMKTEGVCLDKIICSSANRTHETAKLVAEQFEIDVEEVVAYQSLYNAPLGNYLEEIKKTESTVNNLLVVGHNPFISYLVEFLTGIDASLKTSDVVYIDLHIDEWEHVNSKIGTFLKLKEKN